MSKEVSKSTTLSFIISSLEIHAKGERVDRFLANKQGLPSRSQLKDWFIEGRIRRGVEVLEPSSCIHPGDQIEVKPPSSNPVQQITPKKMDLKIYHEDEDLIVLYKPKGLSMHPGAGKKEQTTLVNALLAHSENWSDKSGSFRPGIVHRLDKKTEGIVVVAKNNEVHEKLSQQFSTRTIERAYWALCWGRVPLSLKVEAPIGRNPIHRKKMAVVRSGKPSETIFTNIEYFPEGYSWLECKLMTGRTHQIRVHLSHKGYGILGDELYGRPRKIIEWTSPEKEEAYKNLDGQALVAFRLGFIHPKNKEKLFFETEKPDWLEILTRSTSDD